MEIAGDYVFDAPRPLVWDALQDPNVLGSVMPGGKGFEQTGEGQYNGVLEVKVGPVQGTFQGKITLSDINAPESYKIEVDGKGAPGFVKANGSMRLEARDTQTFMAYTGQAQVGGRIASVGQRLMDSAARSIIRQSLDALNDYLKAQVVQAAPVAVQEQAVSASTTSGAPVAPASPPVSTYKPPSQMSLALNIAKDVLSDFIPPKYQPFVLGAIILIIVLIIWLIVSG